ncbi:hypothetical protein ACFWUZ_09185 [Streptomyces sp. NPDC058646]
MTDVEPAQYTVSQGGQHTRCSGFTGEKVPPESPDSPGSPELPGE